MLLILVSRFSLADAPTPQQTAAEKERIGEITAYIRKQSLQGMSILPGEAREMLGWFSGNWHSLSLPDDDDEAASGGAQALADSSQGGDDVPVTLSSNYHHKGFLPTHDAMVMGIGVGKNMFDDKLAVTARPFYGQSWHSLHSYQGAEMAMNIANRPDGMPWGKIALGYVRGNDSLTDHGQGMELHGDVDLTGGFKLTSGLRQNSADGNSNYLMLRWKLNFGDNP